MPTVPEPSWHARLSPWVNDPIPFWWEGVWHVFLQHNPDGPNFGRMCWGHVSSPDLQNWTEHPIALAPGTRWDAEGVWTGCVVRHEGRFWMFYTGISSFAPLTQHQCLAWSEDLITWTRREEPLMAQPPPSFGLCFRDPHVFRCGDRWKMAVGSQTERGGAVLLYGSQDLLDWEFEGPLWEAEGDDVGFDCECPDFFPFGETWVLISSRGSVHWQAGSFDGSRFVPQDRGLCDGERVDATPEDVRFAPFYAAKSAVDGSGRRLLFGWGTGAAGPGWRGMTCTPRVVSAGPDGLPLFSIPAELADRFVPLEGGFQAADGPLVERIDSAGRWNTSFLPAE
ncbi:MAG: glycoside hydrolase family 32 protein [Fimbriimonadaceae bacterium]|nr:glycoside hydrolase family 32 protein [Fimbriimonadaceae bacterium]